MPKTSKLKPVPPEVKLRRRIRRYAKRALLLTAAIIGYFYLLPIIMPGYAPSVNQSKANLMSAAHQAQTQLNQVLGVATQLATQVVGKKGEIESKGPEALVEEVVDDLTQRVKQLPGEQVRKVKRQFCADVIEEAILACEATNSPTSP